MMTFINMDSEGLVILPTHRVVFGLARALRPARCWKRRGRILKSTKLSESGLRMAAMTRLRADRGQRRSSAVTAKRMVFC